jgi:hypothetical protein
VEGEADNWDPLAELTSDRVTACQKIKYVRRDPPSSRPNLFLGQHGASVSWAAVARLRVGEVNGPAKGGNDPCVGKSSSFIFFYNFCFVSLLNFQIWYFEFKFAGEFHRLSAQIKY